MYIEITKINISIYIRLIQMSGYEVNDICLRLKISYIKLSIT